MPRAKRLAAWLSGAALATVQMCAPAVPVLAQQSGISGVTRVAVGETSALEAPPGAADALRVALSDELGLVSGLRLASTPSARYVVRGAVTRLEQLPNERDFAVRCEVSLLVADARGGSVRVMLSGRASARGHGRDAARLRQTALRAAVHGALRPLGATLLAMR